VVAKALLALKYAGAGTRLLATAHPLVFPAEEKVHAEARRSQRKGEPVPSV